MATSSTTFIPGGSGNPKGRPASMRTALRKALSRTEPPGQGSTMLEHWAWMMCTTAVSFDRRLELMRFIEGESGRIPEQPPAA